jgi:hypothetical protein
MTHDGNLAFIRNLLPLIQIGMLIRTNGGR